MALWREAVRVGGDSALVSALLEAAAAALPGVVMTSIKEDNGSTASRLLRTILAVIPPQVCSLGSLRDVVQGMCACARDVCEFCVMVPRGLRDVMRHPLASWTSANCAHCCHRFCYN